MFEAILKLWRPQDGPKRAQGGPNMASRTNELFLCGLAEDGPAKFDNKRAQIDHKRAQFDHKRAQFDHTRAQFDHKRAQFDRKRA